MFASQNTLEQKQEKCLGNDRPFNSYISMWNSTLCAWCLSEQGIPAGEGSHGICREHADQLLQQQRKLRRRHSAVTA